MIIKIDILLEIEDEWFIEEHKGPRENWPQVVLDEITSNLNFDGNVNIIIAESYEGGKASG